MAARFWVGGAGTWDGTTGVTGHWATTAGGAATAFAPTSSDDANFDRVGLATGDVVTIATGAICNTVNFSNSRGVFAFGSSGSIEVAATAAGTVFTSSSSNTFTGTNPLINITGAATGSRTIAPTAVTEANTVSFNISGGTSTSSITVSTGSIRSLTFSGTFAGTWSNNASISIYGNLTLKSGMTAADTTRTFTFSATSGTQTITSGGIPIGGSFTFNGSSSTTYQLLDDVTFGNTTRRTHTLTLGTLDLNNRTLTIFGNLSSNVSSIRAIAFGTSGVINITNTGTDTYWNFGTISNFTRTGTPYVKFTGTNTTASTITVQHGTTSGGNENNSMSFYFDSSPTVTLSTSNWIYDLGLLSGGWGGVVTGASTNSYTIYGSYYGYANVFGILTFSSTKSTARYLPKYSFYNIFINSTGTGTYNLQANSSINGLYIQSGLFSTSGFNLNVGIFDFNNINTKNLTFNSTVTLESFSSGSATFIGNLTNTTINTTGSTFVANCSTGTKTFDVPNLTYPSITAFTDNTTDAFNKLVFGSGATTQTVTNLTINNNLNANTATIDFNVQLFAGSTLNVGSITIAGNNVNGAIYVALSSTTAGTQATLSKTSGTVSVSYVKIKDSIATGGATWLAPTTSGNINNGNNTGWIFGAYSANNSKFLAFF
jgi:hypothetical protein